MRFVSRALGGLGLTALFLALLAAAGLVTMNALDARNADQARPPAGRERVFAAEVGTLNLGTETPVLVAFGEIQSRRTLELRAPAEGRVLETAPNLEEGGLVRAGDLILRIDPADAQAQLDTARADLHDAQNDEREALRNLALAQEELASAQGQAELRSSALTRARDLFDRGVGSAAAVETAELAAAAAEAQIIAQRRALAQAEGLVESSATAIERRQIALAEAERQLADTELRAAFDGVLTDVDIAEGRILNRNERIAQLIDPSALEVAFRVSTGQFVGLLDANGDLPELPVRAALDIYGLNLEGRGVLLRESGSVGEGQSGRLLFADLTEASGLRVGDFVQVEVEEPQVPGVARIPSNALGSDGDILLIGADNVLEAHAAEVVRRQGNEVLVRVDPNLEGREYVRTLNPVLGAGIRIEPLRLGETETSEAPGTISLDAARRARLIAFVQGSRFIPADVRERMLQQLEEELVPAQMVTRLEERMGG